MHINAITLQVTGECKTERLYGFSSGETETGSTSSSSIFDVEDSIGWSNLWETLQVGHVPLRKLLGTVRRALQAVQFSLTLTIGGIVNS